MKKQSAWPIYVGDMCNLKCIYCACHQESFAEVKKKNPYKSFEEVKNLLDYYKKQNPVGGVSYDGGDITIFPYFLSLLKYGQKIGIRQSFTTNGIMLADKGLVKKIKKYGVESINLSIHTYKREHSNYLSGGREHFDSAVKAWKNCLQEGIEVNINYMIMNNNVEDILGFYLFALKRVPTSITFSLYFSYTDSNEPMNILACRPESIGKSLYNLLKFKAKLDKKHVKEVLPISFFNIPFCFLKQEKRDDDLADFFGGYPLLEDNMIATTMEAESFAKFDAEHMIKEFHKTEDCKKCLYNDQCSGAPEIYTKMYGKHIINPYHYGY